ncbi:hypothetical protein TSUD_18580 [Trifolium subterraneum]|uniref:RNase H type-1 domain-containing protein n=1 Tax=Trifolium subterraneum TaxID=3900 RepID=A0A2Z6MFE2_TRISU|nr:hypothetical protein TSUD_18580 [Trifolium subterraneum]
MLYLWMWRNKSIFEEDFRRPNNPTHVVLKKATEIDRCMQKKDTIFIGWNQPQEGWIKLNCDGTHKSSTNMSGCEGLFRDSNARRQGITHLQVESDSKVLVDMVTKQCNVNGNIPTLIKCIHDLKNMNWHVQFNHTWREGNRSADWLANFSLTLNSYDLQVLETPPRELKRLLFYDTSGACMPRSVYVVS